MVIGGQPQKVSDQGETVAAFRHEQRLKLTELYIGRIIPIEPGRHTLQVRDGRNSSRVTTFEAADGDVVAFRCTGKSFLPRFLLSFVVPSLAISHVRE